ncbi:MAG: hypothetical protein JWN03_5892 [Nocardia sp.]|uniref:hypothetical protein n=1 Tax=Nocardia sp. TaxID=1821 RepID=UPI002632A29D|nr:hypothetical protein [Nocardia sp.]MCU1645617.1 hypothetical protein [Nocardia sp.]
MSAEVASELRRLEDEGSTGVLRAGDGAFHFAEGAIACADCRRTTGLDRLVVEAGVATAEQWQLAAAGDPGPLLARPQFETLAVLSIFDAAYFLLSSPVVPEFRPAPPHWLAPVCRIAPRALVAECARRGDPQAGPWPITLIDRAPVIPARRIRRRRVVLTGSQAEVLAAADAQRSITGIADELGRTTFGCLTAVRELTAAGLIEAPVVPQAEPERPARVQIQLPPQWQLEPPTAVQIRPPTAVQIQSPADAQTERRVALPPAPLPRRRVRTAAMTSAPDRWKPIDREVLVRVRTALEELA